MPHIVGDACVKCKFTDCVDSCPVTCFHETPDMLVIDPEVCIDCGACIPECPVDAIFLEEELPEDQQEYIEINRVLSTVYPVLEESGLPHPECEKYTDVTNKRHLIKDEI